MGTTEWIVVVLVVGGRLVRPLLIPYFPVPALVACMILDSADQSISQHFAKIPLDGYQSYDKALDVYYPEQQTAAPEAGPQPSPGPA